MGHPTRLELDLSALQNNIRELQRVNGDNFFCPMIKANAYGHGVGLIAPALLGSGVTQLGVARVDEGVELRRLGIKSSILIFSPLSRGDADAVHEFALTPVVGRFEDMDELSGLKTPLTIHLKFNTGMQRHGFDESDVANLKDRLRKFPQWTIAGTCTHLTHGEESLNGDGPTARQFARFLKMSEGFPGLRHAHKSSSLAVPPDKKIHPQVGARPGISIYGLPHNGRETAPGLKPVATWRSRLTNIHRIEKGESASYSGRWVAPRRSWIGVVPVGYGDGYSRLHSNKGRMIYRGHQVPVIGSVCMDYTLLDLTEALSGGTPQAGEDVILMGREGTVALGAEDLAETTGTIAYEVLTSVSARVARVVS